MKIINSFLVYKIVKIPFSAGNREKNALQEYAKQEINNVLNNYTVNVRPR